MVQCISREDVEESLVLADFDPGEAVVRCQAVMAQKSVEIEEAGLFPASSSRPLCGEGQSFAKALGEGDPGPPVKTTAPREQKRGAHRRWWAEINEYNIGHHFRSGKRSFSAPPKSAPSRETQEPTELQEPTGLLWSSSSSSSKITFLQSVFDGEVDPAVVADVLAFCEDDISKSTEILTRMLKTVGVGTLLEPPPGSPESPHKHNDAHAISLLKTEFPDLELSVLTNVLEAAQGSVQEAVTLLSLEFGEEDSTAGFWGGDSVDAPKDAGDPDSSWQTVVNKGKLRSDLRTLKDIFEGQKEEFLEDAHRSMGNNLDETIERLAELGLKHKIPKVVPPQVVRQSFLPRKDRKRSLEANERDCGAYRNKASQCDAAMRRAFQLAFEAFQNGHKKEARALADQGRRYKRESKEWSAKAAEKMCQQINSGNSSYYRLDLHGLRVEEAIQAVSGLIPTLKDLPGGTVFHVITGRGRGSQGGVSKLKPALESYLKEESIHFQVPDDNEGEYYIFLKKKGTEYLRKA
ncbi:Smr domain-containing protein [Chloropicon primus]|nr:Smr domain-containing protein [Chloropicon primus]